MKRKELPIFRNYSRLARTKCRNLQELREMYISNSEDHVHSGDSWEINVGKSPVYEAHLRVLYQMNLYLTRGHFRNWFLQSNPSKQSLICLIRSHEFSQKSHQKSKIKSLTGESAKNFQFLFQSDCLAFKYIISPFAVLFSNFTVLDTWFSYFSRVQRRSCSANQPAVQAETESKPRGSRRFFCKQRHVPLDSDGQSSNYLSC